METNPKAIDEFKAHFGQPPGSQDAHADCKNWERLCASLIEERQRLREQLAKAEADREDFRALVMTSTEYQLTKEEIMAHAFEQPTLQELIAELGQSLEK